MNHVTAKKAGDDDDDDDDDAVQIGRGDGICHDTRHDPRRLVSDRSSGAELRANDLNSR